ncbi:MAG TPA: hypothetical protein VK615_05100, partial [Candidatus Binatia bacterium]|nr:hypothetical protein [Candidatus Binatia bacterium]
MNCNSNSAPPNPPAPPPCQGPNCTSGSSASAGSFDPNDKLAPSGYGEAGFIQFGDTLAYEVRFENKSDATAPARLITVTDTLDPNLDLSAFELFQISFANQTLSIPTGLDRYEDLIPLTFTNPLTGVRCDACVWLEVQAALDFETRTLTLTLSVLDPLTGWYPDDPLLGLLYPENGTGRGQGSISYLVSPNANATSGTIITNRARIVFDYNDPIDTPLVSNAIDSAAPSSHVSSLAPNNSPSFLVQWSGSDSGGGGIANYDVYYSADGTNYIRWLDHTTTTSTIFSGAAGFTYRFYSVARDNVGYEELPPLMPDAQTTTSGNTPPILNTLAARVGFVGRTLFVTNSAFDLDLPAQRLT